MKKNKTHSDFQIIESIKKRHTSDFRLLVEKYKDVSFSLACSILKDEHEAEDALQESFLKAFNGIHKFKHKSSFSTWLYRIVVNTCFTIAKKQNKMQLNDNLNYDKSVDMYTGYDKLLASERTNMINMVLQQMKPEESLLLRLYYLSELSVNDIINVTGFKESKVKVTLHRARKSLLENLENILGKELKQFI